MKIKEVIEQTGLTDRAIRLYISNGLIAPATQHSYTGRNSYHFSEEDVLQLKRIALLRKADFSLEQIGILQLGGEPVKEMLTEYADEKREQLKRNEKILSVLHTIQPDSIPNMETLCEMIRESFETEPVPKEDLKPTLKERLETWMFRILTLPVFFFFGLTLLGMKLSYEEEFLFPKLGKSIVSYFGIAYVLIPILMMCVILFLYRKPVYTEKKKKARRITAVLMCVLTFFSVCNPLGAAAMMLYPTVYSETDDPYYYLQLGTYERMYAEDIYALFPANIPRCAVAEDSSWYPPDKFPDTTQYYYLHTNDVDPAFEIYAQWILTEDKFRQEISRFKVERGEEIVYREQRGDWTCLHFTDCKTGEIEKYHSYYFLIFAFNEEKNAVRYIASYTMDRDASEPNHFMSLDWE